MVYHLWARRENCAQRNPLTGETKYSKVLDASQIQIVGVFNGEGPPVPIPNTEVKLTSADNTCLETDREDRSMPTQRICAQRVLCSYASLAQQVEHAAVNRRVVGSNPTGGAMNGIAATRHVAAIAESGLWTVSSVGRAAGS